MNLRQLLEQLVEQEVSEQASLTEGLFNNFDIRYFQTLNLYDKMYYAEDTLGEKQLGCGSSRCTFVLSTGKVLKIAKSEQDLFQNKTEIRQFEKLKNTGLIAKIFSYDKQNFEWIIAEPVRTFQTDQQFKNLTGFNDDAFMTFGDAILNYDISSFAEFLKLVAQRVTPSYKNLTKTITPLGKQLIEKLIQAHKLNIGDIARFDHWGFTTEQNLVIVDYGYGIAESAIAGGGVSATGGGPVGQETNSTHKKLWSGNLEEKRSESQTSIPIIAYHGTTSKFLPNIVNNGLSPKKEVKKNIWQGKVDDLDSLAGIYLGTQVITGRSYAEEAARHFGGQPVILVVQVVPQSAMADEDDFDLQKHFYESLKGLELDYRETLALFLVDPQNPLFATIKENYKTSFHQQYSKSKNHSRPDAILELAFVTLFKRLLTKQPPSAMEVASLFRLGILEAADYFSLQDPDFNLLEECKRLLFSLKLPPFNEQEMKAVETKITTYYAGEIRKQRSSAGEPTQNSFRINQTIGFSGRNKIVGILKQSPNKFNWELLYGQPYEAKFLLSPSQEEATWTTRERQLKQQRQPVSQQTEALVQDISTTVLENLADKMGLKKATSQVRRDVVGGSPVYMDRHDGDQEGTKKVMAKVAKNLNKKPYSKDPPRMGLAETPDTEKGSG